MKHFLFGTPRKHVCVMVWYETLIWHTT